MKKGLIIIFGALILNSGYAQEEAEAMKLAPLYPRTRRERAFDKRVDYWRDNLSEIQVAPFNHDNWSVI